MFKINDKVIFLGNEDGIIIKILENKKYLVKHYIPKKYNDKEKEETESVFFEWELTRFDNNTPTYNKRNDIEAHLDKVKVNTNVKRFYRDYLRNINFNPFYQRDLVWTLDQKREYIEYLFENKVKVEPKFIVEMDEKTLDDKYEILDGKQRLSAIIDFIENKFSIFDDDYYVELNAQDKNYFLSINIEFERISINNFTRNLTNEEKIELFLIENKKGTIMDRKHLKKLEEMLIV